MIRPWFVSYPRAIAASAIASICSVILISLMMYDPMEPSVLFQASDVFPPSPLMYMCNSIAAVYIHLVGWSGIMLLPVMLLWAARIIAWIDISYMSLIAAVACIMSNAMWCVHVACEPFRHVMAGGWIGSYLYRWLVVMLPSCSVDIVLRVLLSVTAFATVKVRWIRYIMPYIERAWRMCTRSVSAVYTWVQKPNFRIFPSLVEEHVAREEQNDIADERDIFHDAFWYRTRSQQQQTPHMSYTNASCEATPSSYDRVHQSQEHAESKAGIASESEKIDEQVYGQPETSPHVTVSESRGVPEHSNTEEVDHPDVRLLAEGASLSCEPDDQSRDQARQLEEKLATFGITGRVTDIRCGPVVTIFSYQPDKAVKVAHITAREDDLRLALRAVSLRIIAPVPGTSVVGFEVSRPQPQSVPVRKMITASDFWSHDIALPLAIGTDTAGAPFISDLAQMPHLLVAGSTGSGKSVGLHSFLVSLLYRCHPDQMKFVLIDPKRLEFAAYHNIPHLAAPVQTHPRSVVTTFEWLVNEMERRYDLLAQAGVRSIAEYHKRYGVAQLPYLVVVVDELADLMMGVGKDIEQYIARLAQMARAAGIHLIVATQRPSVDVVTGMIKVNFLSRIAFKVTSKIDSRTIVDQPGAEKLLGRGDMLHLDARGVLHRLHGGFITQDEIDAVIQHWSDQPYGHTFMFDPTHKQHEDQAESEDDLYHEVRAYVQTCDAVSISLIQRRFRIGYNRSARLIDALERDGVVAAADSSKMRKVLQ